MDYETIIAVYFILGVAALGITVGVFYAIRSLEDIDRDIKVLLHRRSDSISDVPVRHRRGRSDKSDSGGTQ